MATTPDASGQRDLLDLWPVSIIKTRYNGAYEGGAWAAFHCGEQDIPPEATGSDAVCSEFWESDEASGIGVGETPDGAHTDLVRKSLRWAHCSPALLGSGVDCAETPRRACECPGGGSHDYYDSDATCRHHAARLPAPSYLVQESGHAPDPRSI